MYDQRLIIVNPTCSHRRSIKKHRTSRPVIINNIINYKLHIFINII